MARIQLYESAVARPVASPVLRPMPTGNPLEGFASALAGGAEIAHGIAAKFQEEEDNRVETGLRVKAIEDFDAFSRTLDERNDYQNFGAAYDAFVEDWQKENLGGVNDRVSNQFAPFLAEMKARNLIGTRDQARKTQIGVSLADLDQKVADAQNAY